MCYLRSFHSSHLQEPVITFGRLNYSRRELMSKSVIEKDNRFYFLNRTHDHRLQIEENRYFYSSLIAN